MHEKESSIYHFIVKNGHTQLIVSSQIMKAAHTIWYQNFSPSEGCRSSGKSYIFGAAIRPLATQQWSSLKKNFNYPILFSKMRRLRRLILMLPSKELVSSIRFLNFLQFLCILCQKLISPMD